MLRCFVIYLIYLEYIKRPLIEGMKDKDKNKDKNNESSELEVTNKLNINKARINSEVFSNNSNYFLKKYIIF